MSTYTGFDMAPSALRWIVRDGAGSEEAGGPIYGIRGCPRHSDRDYDSAVSWSDAMSFREGEFTEKFESGVEKTVRYELPEGHASEWLRSFFQSAEGHPAIDVNGTIAVAVPDHASPEDRDDVLAGLSVTKYANVSLIWRSVAALLGWMDHLKNKKGKDLSILLNRRIFVLDLDAGRPELTELKCVRHRTRREWIVPSRKQPTRGTLSVDDSFERDCYRATLDGVPEWEQLVGGQFYADLQGAIESGDDGFEAWVRKRGAWQPRKVAFAHELPKDILQALNPILAEMWRSLGANDILLVNGWVARKYGAQILTRFRTRCRNVEALPSNVVSAGAALFAERLAKGLPTFYDRIADYQFWDGFQTTWVSMFDGEQEVEPGREYRYPEADLEPRKLKIEKYADNVSFYVREPTSREYARRIKTQFAEFLRSDLALSLTAVVWPEKGSARFELAMCDRNAPAIFVSGKTTAREIVLRWRNEDNAAHKEVSVQFIQEHQGYVEPQPVLGRIYDSEDNLRMVEEFVANPQGPTYRRLWAKYSAQYHPRNGIADRVGYSSVPQEPTRGLFGTRRVENSRIDAVTYAYAKHCATHNPFNTAEGMKFQNYCHVSAIDAYKNFLRDALKKNRAPDNFNFCYGPGYVLGEFPGDIRLLMAYIVRNVNIGNLRCKLWWSFFRMLCWHTECKLEAADKPLLESCLNMLCDQDAMIAANGGRYAANDMKFVTLAILYSLRIRESGEDLSNPLKQQLIDLLSPRGLLGNVGFPQTMIPKVNPVSRPLGDTLSKYVLRFIKYEDTLADRELGAAMGGV